MKKSGNSSESDDQLQGLGLGLNFNNYDVDNVDVEEAINMTFVVDCSISIKDYVKDLNDCMEDFMTQWKKSHHAPKIFVQIIKFGDDVEIVNGFQPISNLNLIKFEANMGMTRLYDAVYEALVNALKYRDSLESSGVPVKTFVWAITDGDDNQSPDSTAPKIKDVINEIKKDERQAGNFISIMFGVGQNAKFDSAKQAMGFQQLHTVGTSAAEIRKMIGIISASVSSASGVADPMAGAVTNF